MGTRSDWANVGRDFKKLGSDFGKTFVKTVAKGAHKIEDWANEDTTTSKNAQEPIAEAEVINVKE